MKKKGKNPYGGQRTCGTDSYSNIVKVLSSNCKQEVGWSREVSVISGYGGVREEFPERRHPMVAKNSAGMDTNEHREKARGWDNPISISSTFTPSETNTAVSKPNESRPNDGKGQTAMSHIVSVAHTIHSNITDILMNDILM